MQQPLLFFIPLFVFLSAPYLDTLLALSVVPQPSVLKTDHRWVLNGIDLSAKFQRYREQVEYLPLTDYKSQDYLNEFFAMSGILLLKESDDYSGSLLGCFDKAELRAMHEDVMSNLEMMPVFNRRTKEEGRILQAVEAIVNSANECEMMPFSEHGLSTSYLHPFLHGLLSDIMPSTIPHCLNLLLPNSVATATHRPDYVVDVYEKNKHAYTNSVGEMKLANVSKGDAVLDLYRTAIFAKECLDKYNLEMVIGFQAIGTTITFYGSRFEGAEKMR
ncbi:hypothetical protein G6F37_011811 [Rhizopus arrhizus]|nr:hypothetical protein G6F38_011701 [Rhizopus arrhizus]KAG1147286.1 hypothetical protein G6F37_011811 [Rhizopus arrhizus]